MRISSAAINHDPVEQPGSAVLTLPQLAHELNSMLDGSMRTLRQAEGALDGSASKATIDTALSRMRLAQSGLREMAELLERTMRQGSADMRLIESDLPLASQVQHIVESLRPLAQQHRVEMIMQINPFAGSVRSGKLGSVVLNTLRNAIEACATVRRLRRVEFSATVNTRDELIMLVSDNGPGIAADFMPGRSSKPEGHGIGLALSKQIILSLGGRFDIVSVPDNQGTVVRMVVPVQRLVAA